MTIGAHQSPTRLSDDWITPPRIIKALGQFDFDPCPSSIQKSGYLGMKSWEYGTDARVQDWPKDARIWLNPPYSKGLGLWLSKLADHGNGIALIFARTETKDFCDNVWEKADAILFLRGRITFLLPDGKKPSGNSGAPSCLVAYGSNNVGALYQSGLSGTVIRNWLNTGLQRGD